MKKKLFTLSLCSFLIALGIFVFTYFLYHHLGIDGRFVSTYLETPQKPFITLLFGIWGVTFLFSSVMALLVAAIFFPNRKSHS